MIFHRRPDGSVVISLHLGEAFVLTTLPERLRSVIESDSFDERIVDRLFPHAYKDAAREREYRGLLGSELRQGKLDAIAAFERTLGAWQVTPSSVEVTIAPDSVDPWLTFLNDMRLFLGTALEIDDNDWNRDPAVEDGSIPEELALLHFLTLMQQALLETIGFSESTEWFEEEALEDDALEDLDEPPAEES